MLNVDSIAGEAELYHQIQGVLCDAVRMLEHRLVVHRELVGRKPKKDESCC